MDYKNRDISLARIGVTTGWTGFNPKGNVAPGPFTGFDKDMLVPVHFSLRADSCIVCLLFVQGEWIRIFAGGCGRSMTELR